MFKVNESRESDPPKRLLLVSSKCKYGALLEKAVKPNIVPVLYSYENTTFDSLLALVSASLSDEKVTSVGCVMTCKHAGVFMLLLNANQGILNSGTVLNKTSGMGMFFRLLFDHFVDKKHPNCRLDFFGAGVVSQLEKNLKEIEALIGVSIKISKDFFGIEGSITEQNGVKSTLGELYFTPEKIRNWSNGTYQTIDLFEKIRMVGKGSFGTAVLYRKKDDNSLVVLKEINMTELNSQERSMAMNETKVLKLLNHPNIICYYDTFEENGVLMIEMEYADNGTLAQFLSKQEAPLDEREIMLMFGQIVSGIRYMHEQKILHRDLKTANLFLTKDGFIKVGDFGVSKIMNSHMKGADTVLGTPYYISPEICEGKPYNEKSDIWALGCILHEMAARQKTFEGTNLPAVVNKIMRGQIAPISGNYSTEFRKLVADMLDRDPELRPMAQILDLVRIPELLAVFDDEGSDRSLSSSANTTRGAREISSASHHETRSVLYCYDTSVMMLSPVEGFPSKIKIQQVAVGENHTVVVATERLVYSWGEGEQGQLGHGSLQSHTKPQVVETLKGKSIISACCGASFSVFVSDNGIVMTCGDGQHGCLGHGDCSRALGPRLIESLLSVDVTAVSCGPQHVIALGSEGEVYAWGNGKFGCLGTGDTEVHEEPTEVTIGEGVGIRDVRCGHDGTIFLTNVKTLLACGNNKNNKLGLNERRGFLAALSNKLKKLEVESKKVPTPVKSIKGVVDVAMGKNHTAVLTEVGSIHMFGSNKNGQLGTGDNKVHTTPYLVKHLKEFAVNTVICGDTYTAAATSDGMVLFWGTHFRPQSSDEMSLGSELPPEGENPKEPASRSNSLFVQPTHRRTHSNTSTVSFTSTMSLNPENFSTSENPSRASSYQDINSIIGSRTTSEFDMDNPLGTKPEMFLTPFPILNIQGSPEKDDETSVSSEKTADADLGVNELPSSADDFSIFLDDLITFHNNFYILVETNAPLVQSMNDTMKNKGPIQNRVSCLNLLVPDRSHRHSASSIDAGDEYTSSETSEIDSFGAAPTWIQDELKNAHIAFTEVASDKSSYGYKAVSNENKKDQTGKKNLRKVSPSPTRKTSPLPLRSEKNKVQPKKVSPRYKASERPKLNSSSDSSGQNISKPAGAEGKEEENSNRNNTSLGQNGRKPRSVSPYVRQMPSNNMARLRVNRGRVGRLNGATSPRPSKSPIRGNFRNLDHDLQAKLAKLQKEKRDTEQRLKELQDLNEQRFKEMQVNHEKERMENEKKLQNEIDILRKELHQQQHMMKDNNSAMLELRRKKSSVTNSKICSLQ